MDNNLNTEHKTERMEDVSSAAENAYGCSTFKPRCLQFFNTIQMHVFWQCVFNFFQGFIVNGVINVIIPALEKRYSLPSSRSGLIASSNDFGAFVCYLFIGYVGDRRNKPRLMAAGMLLMAVGSFIFSLPHFISGPYQYTISDPGSTMQTSNLCMTKNKTGSHHCDVGEQRDSSIGIYSMFIIGQILLGIGASPSFTLGLTYIDENCKPKLTSFYISWTFCISAIGVAVGYIVGGQTLSLFADIDKVSSSSVLLTPKDPQWIGAWWIGTLFGGAMFIFVALPFIGYPKRLPGYKELKKLRKSEAHSGSDETIAKQKHFGKSIKDFPKALLILITNPTYLLINLGASAEALMIGGYATFGAKILQERFSTSLTNAGIIMGIVTIPGSGGGMMLGGYLVKRLRLKCRGIIRLCVCFMSVSLLLAPSFLTYCTRPPIVGISVAYNGTSIGSLTASCNDDCGCNTASYEPVCIENKMIFFTPCHAGCRNVAEDKGVKIYHSCSCLGTSVNGNDTVKEVADGICTKDCVWLYVYCVLMLLIMVVSFATMSPGTTAALRCVPDNQRSMALGVSLLIVRLLGTTPGPILLGFVLDSTCKVWDEKCDGGRGSCWVYDTEDMSIRLMIWWNTIKAMGITFFLLASFVYRAPKESSHNENPTVEIPDPIGSISLNLDANGKRNPAFTKL